MEYRRKRCGDVGLVLADIKNNQHFRHFIPRNIEKVSIETGLA
jgi:hypothetical protein